MKDKNNGLDQWREAFHNLRREDRERILLEVVRGIHNLTDDFLTASKNDTFMTITSSKVDDIADSDILPTILELFCQLKNMSNEMKDDLDSGKRLDLYVGGFLAEMSKEYDNINRAFSQVYSLSERRRTDLSRGDLSDSSKDLIRRAWGLTPSSRFGFMKPDKDKIVGFDDPNVVPFSK